MIEVTTNSEAMRYVNIPWPLAIMPSNKEMSTMVTSKIADRIYHCQHCGKEFISNRTAGKPRKFDSPECANNWYKQFRREEYRKEHPPQDRSNYIIRGKRIYKPHPFVCKICGKEYLGIRLGMKICPVCCDRNPDPSGNWRCSGCGIFLPLDKFTLDKKHNIPRSYCRSCENARKYTEEYKTKRNLREKTLRNSNPKARIDNMMKARISISLKNGRGKNGQRWESLVGYQLSDLITHLQKKFKFGMTLENYGHGEGKWTIDHIIPKSVFNYKNPEDVDFKKCWGLKNLQPMWYLENVRKGAKLDKSFQPSLCLNG